jgi:alpha-amylase
MRLFLGLVIHNHQPVGNYGFVIEDVYERAYRPMLEALERHPGVRVAIHTSGCLFDWIERERPDYIARLRALCDRGQVEMLTGGYYEPILPMIRDSDKRGQIEKLTAYVERHFGQRPAGLWLTERVWEPGLPAPLAEAGVRWTLVDDEHFRMAGMRAESLDGYYLTEDQGERLAIFAGSQRLRYTIPWLDAGDLMAELRRNAETATSEAPYLVLGDDGEKFGAWPTTYTHVWEQGWIESFFTALEDAGEWLETVTPGAYMAAHQARGLVYLPAASYAEMMEWAMPASAGAAYQRVVRELRERGRDDVLAFVRGGAWRSFLAKYPEANAMHKRGLRIATKLEGFDDASARASTQASTRAAAREALWAAQCNCPYWHGVFGGLYLRHIRRATTSNLVRAERLASQACGAAGLAVTQADYDFDGREEILLQSPTVSLLLHPRSGGTISEFDLRRRDAALLDVLARRWEPYHDELTRAAERAAAGESDGAATNIHGDVRVKEQGLASALVFDRYRRGGLQEWLLDPGATVERFARNEAPASFEPDGAWRAFLDQTLARARVTLAREAGGWRVEKALVLTHDEEAITVTYRCTNATEGERAALFVSEWNLSPPQAPEGDDRTALLEMDGGALDASAGPGSASGVRSFAVRGSASYGLRCEPDGPVDSWWFPVQTVSSSEGGVERVFQGISVSLVRRLRLAPGETASLAFRWSVEG